MPLESTIMSVTDVSELQHDHDVTADDSDVPADDIGVNAHESMRFLMKHNRTSILWDIFRNLSQYLNIAVQDNDSFESFSNTTSGYLHQPTTDVINMTFDAGNTTSALSTSSEARHWLATEFQLIKAVVLVVVLSLVLLSTGRLVFRSFAEQGSAAASKEGA